METKDVDARIQTGSATDSLTASTAEQRGTHTPTPWFASPVAEDDYGFPYCTIGPFDVSGKPLPEHVEDAIANVLGINNDAEANAAFIVTACNAHAELLAALKAMLFAPVTRGERRLVKAAEAAIAKAEGRS